MFDSKTEGVSVTPFDTVTIEKQNYEQIMSDFGSGVISNGLSSFKALSLLYRGRSINHIGLFDAAKPFTTISIFNTMNAQERLDIMLRTIHMDNIALSSIKSGETYKQLISLLTVIEKEILNGTFKPDEYKYSILLLCKKLAKSYFSRKLKYTRSEV